jgi:excisionase family DNA binding protein
MNIQGSLTHNYMTPSQAATKIGVSYARVHQLLRDGKMPYIATPLGRLISEDAVERERNRRGLTEIA